MSVSADVCVGCERPMVDQTIKGDLTLGEHHFFTSAKNLTLGSQSGCRNCDVVLDAITTFVGNEDWTSTKPSIRISSYKHTLGIDFGKFIEVFRCIDSPSNYRSCNPNVWNIKELRALPDDTSSQETLRMIQDWTTNCLEHHEHCIQQSAIPLPKRILKITADRIFLQERPNGSAPYACLSHCWGSSGPVIKLTADTVGRLCEGFVTSDLPKTFRDAVEVCRRLGIYYLWIDALCILQDSREDWREAAATMGDIYENAHITIAATSSQGSEDGLFSSTRSVMKRLNKHSHLYVRTRLELFPMNAYDSVPVSMPLLTRAWVYQERRLSPRMIHFGQRQVYWVCRTHFASEDAREDRTWVTRPGYPMNRRTFDWGDKMVSSTLHWQKMVMEYTSLQLTYESDRLAAIAALADRMSRLRRTDDAYIAGIWKNSILSDLLWVTNSYERRPTRKAPSWSWASTQGAQIRWGSYAFYGKAKVVSLEYTAVGAAHLGEVINASITLRVHVLNLIAVDELSPACIDDLESRARLENIFSSASTTDRFRQYNLQESCSEFRPDHDLSAVHPPYIPGRAVKLLVSSGGDYTFGGIVIQQRANKTAEYERIGYLYINLETSRTMILEGSDGDSVANEKERIDNLLRSLPVEEVTIL